MEREIVRSIRTTLYEALFPAFCLSCEKEITNNDTYEWLCTRCADTLTTRWITRCPVCEKDIGFLAPSSCAHTPSHLDSVSFVFLYEIPAVQKLIRAYKYRLVRAVEDIWRAYLRPERLNFMRIPADAVIPIPLHKRKLRERGFNQAEALARIIAPLARIPLDTTLLSRLRGGQAQASIKKPQTRAKNIRGVFHVSDNKHVHNRRFLLIDDVATTTATLEEAARILKEVGARRVDGFVLAKD